MKPRFSAMNFSKFFCFVFFSAGLPPKVDILRSKASMVLDILLMKAGSFSLMKKLVLFELFMFASLCSTSLS